jgi:hypothetical protein
MMMTVMKQNYIHEEIKRILNLGNACYLLFYVDVKLCVSYREKIRDWGC